MSWSCLDTTHSSNYPYLGCVSDGLRLLNIYMRVCMCMCMCACACMCVCVWVWACTHICIWYVHVVGGIVIYINNYVSIYLTHNLPSRFTIIIIFIPLPRSLVSVLSPYIVIIPKLLLGFFVFARPAKIFNVPCPSNFKLAVYRWPDFLAPHPPFPLFSNS